MPRASRPARPISLDDDPDDVIEDGGSVRVPMTLCDSRFRGRGGGTFTDAHGHPDAFACNRPGFRYVKDNGHLADMRQTAAYALEKRRQADANAWRNPAPAQPAADEYETFMLSDAKKALATSRDPERVREARRLLDAQAWREAPQMPAQRLEASRSTSAPSRPQSASKAARTWTKPAAEADLEDLQADAERARAERHERDRTAWERS